MQPDSPPARPPRRRSQRRISFYPVPTRSRRDGWTIQRQAAFISALVATGSVAGACETIGMSRKSAYRLRSRPGAESFAAAWDRALGAPVRKVTVSDAELLARPDLIELHFFRGRLVGSQQTVDLSALAGLVSRRAFAMGYGW